MTTVPAYPLQHTHLGADPHELIPWQGIEMPRWYVNGVKTGEMHDYERVRNDAIEAQSKLDEIEQRERVVEQREQACDARERALGATAARLSDEIGRVAAHWDKIEQARADQQREPEEPLAAPPGDAALPGDPSKQPDPRLREEALPLADATPALHSNWAKQNPDVEADRRGEFLRLKGDETGEQPILPPRLPVAAGLDQTP